MGGGGGGGGGMYSQTIRNGVTPLSLMADILCRIRLRVKGFNITNQKYCGINTWSCPFQCSIKR